MTNIVVLCSEITRGMKSYGPKATILLGKKKEPLIIKQIKTALKLYPDCKIHIVIGFGSQKIQKIICDYNLDNRVNFIIHDDYENHNNGGAFLKSIQHCYDDTLFINNGVILNEAIDNKECCLPVINGKNIDDFSIGSIIDNGCVQHLFYDLDNRWSETVFISKRYIDNIKSIVLSQQEKFSKMFLFEILNHLIDNNIAFTTQVLSHNKLQKIVSHKQQ